MSISPPPSSPPALLARLAAADHAWRGEQARTRLWRAVPWFLGPALLALALDAFFQLSRSARLTLLTLGALALIVLLASAALLLWRRRNAPERIARHLELRAPALGSRLINALQLATQANDPNIPPLTRSLAAQASARSAEDLAATDLPSLARTGQARRALERSLLVAAAAIVLALIFYPVTAIVLPRFIDPFGDHPPYAFTQVDIALPVADGTPIIYGRTLAVSATWSGHAPGELYLTATPPDRPDEPITIPMVRAAKNSFSADLTNVRTDLLLVAHAKNHAYYSAQRLARVVLTPHLEQGWVETTPPAYTALRSDERKLDFKTVSALAGSTLRFRLRSNRPLRTGTLEIRTEGTPEDKPATVALSPSSTYEVDGQLLTTTDARLRFSVTDIDGLVSEYSPETLLSLSHDLPPDVDVRSPAQDGFASVAFTLSAQFTANDDYGLRTLRIHRALNGTYTEPLTIPLEGIQRDASRTLTFDFLRLGARPGDRVSFFAEAIDTAPEAHLSRSRTVTLTLISENEYNNHLREVSDVADLTQKYNALIQRLTALRDEQARLAAEAEALAQAPADATTAAKTAALAARQDALDTELEQLADALGASARPNPVYDFERDLAKRLALESGALRSSAQQSRDDRAAAAQAASPNAQAAALAQRARAQAERLGAQNEQAAQDITEPLQNLAQLHDLVNNFNLFEQAYLAQDALAEQLLAYKNQSTPTREDQLAMKELAGRQAAIREILRQLPDKLRTQATAAAPNFPKAAQASRDLAAAIEETRLGATAENATDHLLQADGRNGSALTQRLAREMRALMKQCNGGESEQSTELDEYLSAKMPSAGGTRQTWEQMRQSRKFSLSGGLLPGIGKGKGPPGGQASGYSSPGNNDAPVFGAEPAAAPSGNAASTTTPSSGQGSGPGDSAPAAVQTNPTSTLKGTNPTDRESGATPSELGAEEYRTLVDEYFKQLTRP